MSADSYWSLITDKCHEHIIKNVFYSAYGKLTESFLEENKYFDRIPEKVEFYNGLGEPEEYGETQIIFSGTNSLNYVDSWYFYLLFAEMIRTEPSIIFDFSVGYSQLDGAFSMHVKYAGDCYLKYIYFNSLNSGGSLDVVCPECGCSPGFDTYPDWFNPYCCPKCGADIEPEVEHGWEDEDVVSDFLGDQLADYLDHYSDSIEGERIHVCLMAEGPMDRDLLSQYHLIYDDSVIDSTNLVIIGSNYKNYTSWSDYGSLIDISNAECRGDDRSNANNWFVGDECISDLTFRNINTKTAPAIIALLKSLYDNGSEIQYTELNLF